MKKMRLLSAILALVMITGSMPASVLADDTEEDTAVVTEITEESSETTENQSEDETPEDQSEEMQPDAVTSSADDNNDLDGNTADEEEITEEDTADICNAGDDEEQPIVKYIKRSYDPDTKKVVSTTYDSPTYIKMSSLADNNSIKLVNNFWYVVDKDIKFNHRITVSGTANLILVNGNTLTCNNGIRVGDGARLNIYGQSGDSGKLVTTTDLSEHSPLGGNSEEKAGTICIYGGTIKADAYYGEGAAIGGGYGKSSDGNYGSPQGIFIYGGNIHAFSNGLGAGIGGGHYGFASRGDGINIYGGIIDTEGHGGAGIGNGSKRSESPGDIRIYGGNIKAMGFGTSAGIGGGEEGTNGKIFIYDGEVEAIATGSKYTGAGIGSGDGSDQTGDIYIGGGRVTAVSRQGAGIGGGCGGDGGEILIEGGVIKAAASQGGAGIGGGKGADGAHVVIRNGCINALSQYFDDSHTTVDKWVAYGEHVQTNVYAEGAIVIFALLYDWVRDTDICGAGIGGGYEGSGKDVEIYGGAVTAMSGYKGVSAIGAGRNGRRSGTINLNSGLKVADRYDENKNPVFVDKDTRRSVIMSQYAFVTMCDHDERGYYCSNVAYHDVDCRFCGEPLSRENHEFDSDGYCIKCGASSNTVTVRFIEQNGSGKQVSYDTTEFLGSRFKLPDPVNVPEGMEFGGWVNVASGDAHYAGDHVVLFSDTDTVYRAVYDNVTVASYIDAGGTERSVRARVVTGDTVCFDDGWYVVRDNATINANYMNYRGHTRIILSDGVKLDIIAGDGMMPSGSSDDLAVYGQSKDTGKMTVSYAELGTFTQYGGCVNMKKLTGNDLFFIYGGEYESLQSTFNDRAFLLGGDIHIGRINISDELKMDWITPDISICFEAIYRTEEGLIMIEGGREFTDGSRNYSGTLTDEQMYMIEDRTLTPSPDSLYGDPEWVWAADHSTAKAVFTPLSGSDAMEIEADVYTGSTPVRTYYTAVAEYHGVIFTDIKEVTKEWNLFVGGRQVTGDNMNDILGDGKVSYDVSTNTLNLSEGAVITPAGHSDGSSYGIRYNINRSVPFTIGLNGSSRITNADSAGVNCYGIAVYNANHNVDAKTVIEGRGTLIISINALDKAYGIRSSGSRFKIDQSNVIIDTAAMDEDRSVSCGDLLLTNGASLTVFSLYPNGYSLYASSIDMSSDSRLDLNSANRAVNEDCVVKEGARSLGATVVSKGGAVSQWDGVTPLSDYEDVSIPDHLAPAGYSLTLDGSIGLNVFVDMTDMSDEEKNESYMTFNITGKGSCTERDDFDSEFYVTDADNDKIYHGFTCRISSVQMADTISCTWHYGSGKSKTYRYSVREYLDYFDSHAGQYSEETIALVHALSDYGHYVQPYLAENNNWTVGEDYAEMDTCFRSSYDHAEVLSAVGDQPLTADMSGAHITQASYCLKLDSSIAAEVILKVDDGVVPVVSGYPVIKTGNCRYKIVIDNINAQDLDKTITVTGDAGGAFSLTFTPLSYVSTKLSDAGCSDSGKDALAALFYYYKAASEYN